MDRQTDRRKEGGREGDACIISLLFNKWMDMFIDT